MKKIAVLAFVALGLTGAAHANIVLTAVTPNPAITGSSPNFTFTYQFSTDAFQRIDTSRGPQYFTIYDIAGLVLGSQFTTAANWSALGATLVGSNNGQPTPSNITDSNAQYNVTYQYTSGAPVIGPNTLLGNFGFMSSFGTAAYPPNGILNFNAQAVSVASGNLAQNQSQIPTPVNGVPEPASMALIGGGLIALAALRRKIAR